MPGLIIHNRDWVWEGRSLQGKFKVLLSAIFLLGSVLVFGQNCGVFNPNEKIESKQPQLVSNADGIPYEGKLTIEVRDRVEPGETEEVTIHGGTPPYQLVASNPDIIIVPGSSSNQFFITIPANASSGKFKLEATDDEGRIGTKEILILGINAFMYDPSHLAISETGTSIYSADSVLGLVHEIDFEGKLIQSFEQDSASFFPTKITSLPDGGLLGMNRKGTLFYRPDTNSEISIVHSRPFLQNYFYYKGEIILVAPLEDKIQVSFMSNLDFTNLEWLPIDIPIESIQSMGMDTLGRFWAYKGGVKVNFYDSTGAINETKDLAPGVTHILEGEPFEDKLIGRVDSETTSRLVVNPFEIESTLIDAIDRESNEVVKPLLNIPDLGMVSLVQKNYNRFIRIYKESSNEIIEWNSGGTKAQNFSHPCDVTVDGSNSVYLIDQLNNRLSKFNSNLEFLMSRADDFIIPRIEESGKAQCFGDINFLLGTFPLVSKGKIKSIANKELEQPQRSLFRDKLYCSKGFRKTCSEKEDAVTLAQFNQINDKMSDFGTTTTSATAPNKSISVVFGHFGATMFVIRKSPDENSSKLSFEELPLREKHGFFFADRVVDSSMTNDGTIFVLTGRAVSGNFMHALDLQGNIKFSFAPPRVENNEGGQGMDLPRAFALDPINQRILITDAQQMNVKVFDIKTGSYIGSIGDAGISELEFRRPMGIAVNFKGELIVSDTGNNRIQVIPNYSDYIQ